MRLAPLRCEAIQGDDQAALLLGDLGQAPALLPLVTGEQGQIDVLIEIAHMGFGDGEPARELGVNLAIGRTLVLP